jgi:hypothetical protein
MSGLTQETKKLITQIMTEDLTWKDVKNIIKFEDSNQEKEAKSFYNKWRKVWNNELYVTGEWQDELTPGWRQA